MMAVKEFEGYIIHARFMFRYHLENAASMQEIKDCLRDFLDDCTNKFEEDTLKENLQEEFGLYLEGLKKAE